MTSTKPLWTWTALCGALKLTEQPGPDISGVCIDSRRVQPGDLFIALTGDPGPRFSPSQRSDRDGHEFIDAAFRAGAVGVLAHDGVDRNVPQLQVADTLDGLWELGAAARMRLECPVVAITGSSGKTTTKSLLASALGAFCTEGSLNNHLGVPLSLIATPADATAAVYELGTSHPGEIAPLSELARPNVAIVLNVHPAHAEHFRGLNEIREEKLSIYKGLEPKGHLILEDEIGSDGVPVAISCITFGRGDRADVQFLGSTNGHADFRVGEEQVSANVPGGGEHRAMSLAAVLATLHAFDRSVEPGLNLADDLIPAGRGSEITVAGITIVDDSYNANPESMKAALRALAASPGRTVAVLGDMLELGVDSPRYHQELADYCSGIDAIICVGEAMRDLYDQLPPAQRQDWFPGVGANLLDRLIEETAPGVRLLVKGSNRVFWAHNFVAVVLARLGYQK